MLAKLEDTSVSIGEIIERAKELSISASSGEVVDSDQLSDLQEVAFLAPAEIIKLLHPPAPKI